MATACLLQLLFSVTNQTSVTCGNYIMLVFSIVACEMWHVYSAACLAHYIACLSHLLFIIVPLLMPGICYSLVLQRYDI